MDLKKIKALLGFLRELRAPIKLFTLLASIVLTIARRLLEQDQTPAVKVLRQSFLGRTSLQLPAGCTSPCLTECRDGSFAAAFAFAVVEDSRVVNRICVVRSQNADDLAFAPRRPVYQTVLSPEQLTLTDTAFGLFLCWNNVGGRTFAAPQAFGKAVAESLRKNADEQRQAACADLGWHCAFVKSNGEASVRPRPLGINAAQPPVRLSNNELLFVTAENGKPVVTRCTLPGCDTQPVCTLALPRDDLVCLDAAVAKLKNGRIAAVLNLSGDLYYAFSDDLGVRWSRCQPMNIKASAPNLCVRSDGVTALSYLAPGRTLSLCARISPDGENDWSDERVVVATPAADFHRPLTAACGDAFLTVSRQRYCSDRQPSALLTRWTIEGTEETPEAVEAPKAEALSAAE